jgi:hypothetical protein
MPTILSVFLSDRWLGASHDTVLAGQICGGSSGTSTVISGQRSCSPLVSIDPFQSASKKNAPLQTSHEISGGESFPSSQPTGFDMTWLAGDLWSNRTGGHRDDDHRVVWRMK